MSDLFASGDRAHARRDDPQTSHRAADAVTNALQTIRRQVEAFAFSKSEEGFIDEELSAAFESADKSSYRTRRAELTEAGTIIDSGRTKANAGGRQCVVWVHRTFANVPPPEVRTPSSDEQTRANAAKVVATLQEAARQMRAEGRIPFSAALQEAANLARAWTL